MAGLSADNPLRGAFEPRAISRWVRRLESLAPDFSAASFEQAVFRDWESLGFGERSARIRDLLSAHLPPDFSRAADLLVRALDPPLGDDELTPLERFLVWPQTAWTAQQARLTGDFETAAHTLREMTMRFSAEGDLRVLFELDERRALDRLARWASDPNPHVRRLVSEGTRPRLPLTARWKHFDHPAPVFALLDRLKDDPSLYVRRSVANNLNDWAKDHPDATAQLLDAWSQGAPEPRQWLIRHAARTLIKRGHPTALALLGVDVQQPWAVEALSVDASTCVPGRTLHFQYELVHQGEAPAEAIVDFTLSPWPGSPRAKVFKGRTIRSSGQQRFALEGQRSLAPTSGRVWRPGPHQLTILVNGRVAASLQVVLMSP